MLIVINGSSLILPILFLRKYILKLLSILFFLEFEVLLSSVHPILFVNFLEHSLVLDYIGCDIKVNLMFNIRSWWNYIVETFFVIFLICIYLQTS